MDGRVRWFFGLARNSGGYSFPMMGTPVEVPEPRKIKENAIMKREILKRGKMNERFFLSLIF